MFFLKNRIYGSYTYDGTTYNIPVRENLIEDSKKILNSKETEEIIIEYKKYSWNINKKIRINNSKEKKILAWKDIFFVIKDKLFDISKKIVILDSIFSKAKLYDNIIVNRTIKGKEFKWIKSCFEEFEKDNSKNTFSKDDFCSTYSNPNFSIVPPKKKLGYLVILVPKNSKAVYLDFGKNRWRIEREILLQKGSKFEFVDVKKFNDDISTDKIFTNKKIFMVRLLP